MEAEMNTAARVDKIVDMIAHYEKYDGRLDNTGNYLKLPDGTPYAEREAVIQGVADKLRQDSIAAKNLLEDIIGDEHEGALVLAHDEWVEAAVERVNSVAKMMGLGVKPLRIEMEPEALNAGMEMYYLYDRCELERFFSIAADEYLGKYGIICKVKLFTEPPANRYLPAGALKCAASSHEVLRALTKLGFQGRMA